MKQNLYIFSDTNLKRKQNTLFFESVVSEDSEDDMEILTEEYLLDNKNLIPSGDKKYIPVEAVDSVFAVGTISFNSRFLYFLSQNRIPLHCFSLKGSYAGSFFPAEQTFSGSVLVKQIENYNNYEKRLYLAKQIISASVNNMLANLKYYQSRGNYLHDYIEHIEEFEAEIAGAETVGQIMGFEGQVRKIYYRCWQQIFSYPVNFFKRVKNPPDNMVNALISYGNMIIYGTILNEIYNTRIYPEIGFIHEPGDNKLSLTYDLADIFKPIIIDRVIFKLINKHILSEKQFIARNGFCRINKKAKQIYSREIEDKLFTKITVDGLYNKLSYKRIIREECLKLIKHFEGTEKYKAFRIKW
ncbi:MAG: type I-B CRISPR-associated endonuclease Cas1 [Melioribacteraceae bacterium]|nr:type I-B CRISPR-associated endonuclease Cas1 [Melioribacteraceae bacterium]